MARKEIVFCDRCGKEYEPFFFDKKEPEYFMSSKNFDDIYSHGLDLCEQCYSELVNWFERGKKNE